jgi:hypothetical protein
MRDDMGTFRTHVEIENPSRRGERVVILMVAKQPEDLLLPAAVIGTATRMGRISRMDANSPLAKEILTL